MITFTKTDYLVEPIYLETDYDEALYLRAVDRDHDDIIWLKQDEDTGNFIQTDMMISEMIERFYKIQIEQTKKKQKLQLLENN